MTTTNEARCSGDGNCLRQAYMPAYECRFKCTPVKCPNFALCGLQGPKIWLACHAGLCVNCDVMFGTWKGGPGVLKFSTEQMECPICMTDSTDNVKMPNCTHWICTGCLRVAFHGLPIPDPPFPYDDSVRSEYYNDPCNQKFQDDPLILNWQKECECQEERRESATFSECPMCRAPLFEFNKNNTHN